MKKNYKNPLIAMILNLLLPGLGYVYIGKRIAFGIGLTFLGITMGFVSIYAELPRVVFIEALAGALLFALDGWNTAKEVNRENEYY